MRGDPGRRGATIAKILAAVAGGKFANFQKLKME